MKRSMISKSCAAAFLFTAISAFAGTPLSQNIKLSAPVTVNGNIIPAGEYKLNASDDGQVSISSGKKILATVQGKVVDHESKAASDSLRLQRQSDGTQKLVEIEFAGKKASFVLPDSESKSSGN
ncbi:MAG: hypothetical protein JWO13_339 [Acidobacteriales bacterium]|nr:hypothetical protein [Terriglobales bacterium]